MDPKTRDKVKRPFYDGLTFHRVIPNFMVQGGCPLGNGTGGPGYHIKCETAGQAAGPQARLAVDGPRRQGHRRFQFFICHSPQPHLDKKHTVFGQVTSGLEVVDKIQAGDKMTTGLDRAVGVRP